MFSKKNLLVVLVVVLFLLSACQTKEETQTSAAQEADMTAQETEVIYEMATVTINDSAQVNYAPIYFAQTEGYFEEYGIELEMISFTRVTEAVPLLVSGDLDVYAGSITSGLINVLGQEPKVKVVADRGKMIEGTCTFQAIVVRKDLYDSGAVRGPADLRGLKIAAVAIGMKGYELGVYLAEAGLTFDDVEIVDLPSSALIDAFNNQAVDVIVTPESTLTRLLMNTDAVILSKGEEDVGPLQTSVLAFGSRLLINDPDLGARFMAAYLKGVQKYNEGKTEDNLQAIAGFTGEDIELLKQACWPPIREDGWIDFAMVDPFQQWNVETGQLDATITEEQFWDQSILEAGLALLNKN